MPNVTGRAMRVSQSLLLAVSIVFIACDSKTRKPRGNQIAAGTNKEPAVEQPEAKPPVAQPTEGGEPEVVNELVLYTEGVESSFATGKWDDNKNSIVMGDVNSNDPVHGMIWNIEKKASGSGNIFIGAQGGTSDLATLTGAYLMFDIRVIKMTGTGLRVKLDSGWPATSDVTIHTSALNIWQTVVIPLDELKAAENSIEPGNRVNLGSVQMPFVLEPVSSEPWQVQLDNIKISTDTGHYPREARRLILVNLETAAKLDKWDQNSGNGQVGIVAGEGDTHQDVVSFQKKAGGPGNAFFKFESAAANLSSYSSGFLVFDMKVVALDGAPVRVKIDSGWPATSDIGLEVPPIGSWQTLRIPLSKFSVDNSLQPGKRFDIASVTNPLVIEPSSEGAWQIHFDHIFLAADGGAGDSGTGGGGGGGGGGGNTPADDTRWNLVWQDEFSGDAIDKSKWEHEVNCWGGGNDEQQCYTDRPQNSFVKDGKLSLVAYKESFTGDDTMGGTKTLPYTSARLRTKGKADFQYGKFCARAKLPMGQGVWPAIWMLPTEWKYGGWPMSGEIDIMEARSLKPNESTEIFGTLHFGGEGPLWKYDGRQHIIPGSASEHAGLNFHTYCVLWDDDAIHWEVDGKNYGNLTQWHTENAQGRGKFPAPFDQKFHFILNVAVGGNFAGNPNDATLTAPQAMEVDWVRAYSCTANPLKPSKC